MNRRSFLQSSLYGAAAARLSLGRAARPEIDREELIDFAKQLVLIPSFTTEETPVAEFLHSYFKRQGFESQLQEVDPGRFQTVARFPGSGGPSLMLNGHIDIDPIPGGTKYDPWKPAVEGDRFYGAGIGNMKGGIASMIMAAVAARRAGVRPKGDVVLACVVGELQGGVGTVHLLRSGVRADAAIVTEPHGAGNILTKHAGVMELALHVIGRTAHISRKREGVNAILKMAKVVEALENLKLTGKPDSDLPGLPLLNVGSIIGGRGREVELRGPNIVPDFATVYVDVRFTQGMTPESVIEDLRRRIDALRREDPELVYEIEYPMKPERRAMREVMLPFSVPAELPLVQKLKATITTVSGKEPRVGAVLPNGYSGNDTSHIYAAGIPCCLYGPAGGYSEADRWCSVEEMLTCARVYAAMIAEG